MAQPRVPKNAGTVVAAVLGVALMAGLLAGCGGDDDPVVTGTVTSTPIGKLDTREMKVVRVEFCDLVPKQAIKRALAGGASAASSWKNGDRVPGTKAGDVGHEVGCAWKGAQGRTARAWVFARPVSTTFAGSLVKSAADQPGCRVVKGPKFGKPSVAQLCSLAAAGVQGGITRVRYAGLFADTWLACEVTGPRAKKADVKKRAGSWCVNVATTLDAEEK